MHCLFEIKNEAKMVISPLFIQNFAGGKEKHRNNRRNIYSICGSVYVGKSKASSIQQLELSMKFSKVKIYKEYKRISYI